MNRPPVLSTFLFADGAQDELGSVQPPAALRLVRPVTFAVWIVMLGVQALTVTATGESASWLVLAMTTALFIGVHLQFWYEQSAQGRRFHRAIEKIRGRVYEDDSTGMPNSRHFVFELRRQMARSIRSGRSFSVILAEIHGAAEGDARLTEAMPAAGRAVRHAMSEGDFAAHLDGAGAIVMDNGRVVAPDKADALVAALGAAIPLELAARVRPVVSITGFEGEVRVRDFLRRAQRDLLAATSRGSRPESARRQAQA